jgi:hypothetical protein
MYLQNSDHCRVRAAHISDFGLNSSPRVHTLILRIQPPQGPFLHQGKYLHCPPIIYLHKSDSCQVRAAHISDFGPNLPPRYIHSFFASNHLEDPFYIKVGTSITLLLSICTSLTVARSVRLTFQISAPIRPHAYICSFFAFNHLKDPFYIKVGTSTALLLSICTTGVPVVFLLSFQ